MSQSHCLQAELDVLVIFPEARADDQVVRFCYTNGSTVWVRCRGSTFSVFQRRPQQ